MAIREQEEIAMDPDRKAQIKSQIRALSRAQGGVQVRALIFDEAPIEVLVEYSDYNNIFLAENVVKLPKNTGIKEHAIKLEEGKQLLFRPIYSLGPVELETLKTYIKTNLANGFIRPFKSLAEVLILLVR